MMAQMLAIYACTLGDMVVGACHKLAKIAEHDLVVGLNIIERSCLQSMSGESPMVVLAVSGKSVST